MSAFLRLSFLVFQGNTLDSLGYASYIPIMAKKRSHYKMVRKTMIFKLTCCRKSSGSALTFDKTG
jgi:hypothetical protein